MVIWSILPEEVLFSHKTAEVESVPEEIDYGGCKIIAQAINDNQYQIVRIISTNPNDYLNNKLQPGEIIYCKRTFAQFA